jgi:sugar phosphate isomerase/epimerase
MKFSIAIGKTTTPTTPLLLEGSFSQSILTARSIGYDAVEIHTPDPEEMDIDELNRTCRECGMSIETIGTGILYGKYKLHLMDQDEERRKQLIERVKSYINIAASLNSRVTIGSIKGNIPAGGDREKYINSLYKSLKSISEYATEKGVIVLLEATNRYENNVLNTAREVYDTIDKNGLKNFKVLLDSFHINIEESDITGCLADAGKYLGYIHFGDNHRRYPGTGSFRFDIFCRGIKDIGYNGVLSAECFPQPDGLTAAKETIKFFRKHFS